MPEIVLWIFLVGLVVWGLGFFGYVFVYGPLAIVHEAIKSHRERWSAE